jgi:competence protein CoiA
MLYALMSGEKVRATPGARAECPGCRREMVAKCGEVVMWHWAHMASPCGDWEPETDWHLEWKSWFPPEWVEVFRGGRRADVLLPSGTAIEFQRRGLGAETIRAREANWGRVIWVMYAEDLYDATLSVYGEATDIPRLDLRTKYDADGRVKYTSFRWRHPRRSWEAAEGSLVMDFGEGDLFEIRKVHWDGKVGGWGHMRDQREMLNRWTGVHLPTRA